MKNSLLCTSPCSLAPKISSIRSAVAAAEETVQLRLVTRFANEQQQVTLLGLALHNGDAERIAQVRGNTEFKELTFAIALDVEGVILGANPGAISLGPTGRNLTHFDPSTHLGKPGFNRLRIHIVLI